MIIHKLWITGALLAACSVTNAERGKRLRKIPSQRAMTKKRTPFHGACEDDEILQVPFETGAANTCVAFLDFSEEHLGASGCSQTLELDTQANDDATCAARGGSCHVAFTEPGEWLEYALELPRKNGYYDIILRMASKEGHPRPVQVTLGNNGNPLQAILEAPENGFQVFDDRIWERVLLQGSGDDPITDSLVVEFIEGFTNLCSISVLESPVLTIPFEASALEYAGFVEKSNAHFGVCDEYPPGNPPVDALPTSDEGCVARSNINALGEGKACSIGWTQKGESLTYLVENGQDDPTNVELTLRIASNSGNRFIEVGLEEDPSQTFDIEAPGDGWHDFQDFAGVLSLASGVNHVVVKFLDNNINLCAISAKFA